MTTDNLHGLDSAIEEFMASFLQLELDTPETLVSGKLAPVASDILKPPSKCTVNDSMRLEFDDRREALVTRMEDIRHALTPDDDEWSAERNSGIPVEPYMPATAEKRVVINADPALKRMKREGYVLAEDNRLAWDDGLVRQFPLRVFNGYSVVSYSHLFPLLYPYTLARSLMADAGFAGYEARDAEGKLRGIRCAHAVARVLTFHRGRIEACAKRVTTAVKTDLRQVFHDPVMLFPSLTAASAKLYPASGSASYGTYLASVLARIDGPVKPVENVEKNNGIADCITESVVLD